LEASNHSLTTKKSHPSAVTFTDKIHGCESGEVRYAGNGWLIPIELMLLLKLAELSITTLVQVLFVHMISHSSFSSFVIATSALEHNCLVSSAAFTGHSFAA